jgi:cytochrome c-type biogenesis protein CcmH
VKLSLLAAGLVLLLAVFGVSRLVDAPRLHDDVGHGDVDQESIEIARLLKCPVCQSQSVAESSSPLAGQIRDLIHQKLAAGESREAVLAYFTGIYGEDVLLDPPKAGFGSLVWLGVLVVPVAGLALAWWSWRGKAPGIAREPDSPEDSLGFGMQPLDDDEVSLSPPELEAELERLVGGDAR